MNRFALAAAAAAVLALSGCTALSGPRPDGTDPTDPRQVAIDSAGDVGALCLIIPGEVSPADLVRAQLSAQAASTVLSDPRPNIVALERALTEGVPERYAKIGAIVIGRLKARLGAAQVLDKDTVAYAMAEEFVAQCRDILGPPPAPPSAATRIWRWLTGSPPEAVG